MPRIISPSLRVERGSGRAEESGKPPTVSVVGLLLGSTLKFYAALQHIKFALKYFIKFCYASK